MRIIKIAFTFFLLLIFAFSNSSVAEASRAVDVDILIFGGTVVTMDKDRRLIEDGAVAIKGEVIVAVGKRSEIARQYPAKRVINCWSNEQLDDWMAERRSA